MVERFHQRAGVFLAAVWCLLVVGTLWVAWGAEDDFSAAGYFVTGQIAAIVVAIGALAAGWLEKNGTRLIFLTIVPIIVEVILIVAVIVTS